MRCLKLCIPEKAKKEADDDKYSCKISIVSRQELFAGQDTVPPDAVGD